MMDLLVQLAVVAVILAMVVLFVITQERRATLRERILHPVSRRHWRSRTRNGH